MNIKLSDAELRVLGCLLEKETTTPDQYPLSLNALTNACNQKSNRDPVVSFDESEVQETLDVLSKKHYVVEKSPFGGRTAKFQHRFCNSEFSELQFSAQERGILCVLFLRGPQSAGELRTRTNRLCAFNDVNEVEAALEQLINHKHGPFVKKLPRQSGQRDSRYIHLCGEKDIDDADYAIPHASSQVASPATAATPAVDYEQRIQQLEQEVIELRSELSELKEIVNQFV
ncbi:MAG: DUF480 domain-containing protein [Gammaproteobacteria bacterium]|nr:DUF480 domain-containing protein [Gammaproteobacteria bacterium]MDH5801607.1 DUF480 domain-containing protein [Gammaproteobacteria bacterium]